MSEWLADADSLTHSISAKFVALMGGVLEIRTVLAGDLQIGWMFAVSADSVPHLKRFLVALLGRAPAWSRCGPAEHLYEFLALSSWLKHGKGYKRLPDPPGKPGRAGYSVSHAVNQPFQPFVGQPPQAVLP